MKISRRVVAAIAIVLVVAATWMWGRRGGSSELDSEIWPVENGESDSRTGLDFRAKRSAPKLSDSSLLVGRQTIRCLDEAGDAVPDAELFEIAAGGLVLLGISGSDGEVLLSTIGDRFDPVLVAIASRTVSVPIRLSESNGVIKLRSDSVFGLVRIAGSAEDQSSLEWALSLAWPQRSRPPIEIARSLLRGRAPSNECSAVAVNVHPQGWYSASGLESCVPYEVVVGVPGWVQVQRAFPVPGSRARTDIFLWKCWGIDVVFETSEGAPVKHGTALRSEGGRHPPLQWSEISDSGGAPPWGVAAILAGIESKLTADPFETHFPLVRVSSKMSAEPITAVFAGSAPGFAAFKRELRLRDIGEDWREPIILEATAQGWGTVQLIFVGDLEESSQVGAPAVPIGELSLRALDGGGALRYEINDFSPTPIEIPFVPAASYRASLTAYGGLLTARDRVVGSESLAVDPGRTCQFVVDLAQTGRLEIYPVDGAGAPYRSRMRVKLIKTAAFEGSEVRRIGTELTWFESPYVLQALPPGEYEITVLSFEQSSPDSQRAPTPVWRPSSALSPRVQDSYKIQVDSGRISVLNVTVL